MKKIMLFLLLVVVINASGCASLAKTVGNVVVSFDDMSLEAQRSLEERIENVLTATGVVAVAGGAAYGINYLVEKSDQKKKKKKKKKNSQQTQSVNQNKPTLKKGW